jgi:hypothetical protein
MSLRRSRGARVGEAQGISSFGAKLLTTMEIGVRGPVGTKIALALTIGATPPRSKFLILQNFKFFSPRRLTNRHG